jgi:MFS family permease
MELLDEFRGFWGGQSRNFKAFLMRDVLETLLGNIGGRYASIYMRNLGASAVDIGTLNSAASLVRLLLALPAGLLTDRVRRVKGLYLLGRLLMLPVNLAKALAWSFRVYFLARIWEVITFRVLMPTSSIISISSISNRERVRGWALRRTATSAVGLVAPILSAYAVVRFGGLESVDSFRPLFLIQFAVGIVVFLLLATQLEEPGFERSPHEPDALRSTLDVFRRAPGMRMILLLNVVRAFFIDIRLPLIQLYSYEVKNAGAWIIGFQGTVSTATMLLFSVPMGNLTDRIGRRKMAYLSQVAFAACVLSAVLTPATHPELLLVYSFLHGLAHTMEVGWTAFLEEYIPLELRGRWSGINTMATALVGIPAPIIGGLIWEVNPDYLWWIGVFFYLFLAIPLMRSVPERRDQVAMEGK